MSDDLVPYDAPLPPLVIEPPGGAGAVDSAFVFLHGLGDEGASYKNLAEQIHNAGLLHSTRFIFPTADFHHGADERAWYAPVSVQDSDPHGEPEHYTRAMQIADELVQEQVLKGGVRRNRIILGGFSQGGAVTALWSIFKQRQEPDQREEERVAGLVLVASYVPMRAKFNELVDEQRARDTIKDQPLLVLHGQKDTLVQPWVAQEGIKALQEAGFEVNYAILPDMRHDMPGASIGALCGFLKSVLADQQS